MTLLNTKEEFDAVLEQSKDSSELFVIVFEGHFCADCHFLHRFWPDILHSFPDMKFFRLYTEDIPEVFTALNVIGIPSFILYNKGVILDSWISRDRKMPEEIKAFLKKNLEKIS